MLSCDIPLLARTLILLAVAIGAVHYAVYIALWCSVLDMGRAEKRWCVGTHGLFVEAVEEEARGGGRLLRACTDLVDCVERMAEDAIYDIHSVSDCASCDMV